MIVYVVGTQPAAGNPAWAGGFDWYLDPSEAAAEAIRSIAEDPRLAFDHVVRRVDVPEAVAKLGDDEAARAACVTEWIDQNVDLFAPILSVDL